MIATIILAAYLSGFLVFWLFVMPLFQGLSERNRHYGEWPFDVLQEDNYLVSVLWPLYMPFFLIGLTIIPFRCITIDYGPIKKFRKSIKNLGKGSA